MNRRYKICGLMLFLFIIGGAPVSSEEKNDVIAIAGERSISMDEFDRIIIQYRKSGDFEKISQTLDAAGKKKLLNRLIDEKLMAAEAVRIGLNETPELQAAIQNAIDRILAEAFFANEKEKLDLSDTGLRRFYADHPELFTTAERVRARHIVVRTANAAEQALKQIKQGGAFSEVASEVNIDSSRSKGGDLGWVSPGIMVEPFDNALFSLEQGQISPIVKTRFGYHIIKAEAIDPGRVLPFEAVKSDVKQHMIQERLSEVKRSLRQKYPVKIHECKLNELR